jgi:hypothetical protein
MVSLELGRHNPEAGGFCLDLSLIIPQVSRVFSNCGFAGPEKGLPGKMLIVDANILIRAVLGRRVRHLLDLHGSGSPTICLQFVGKGALIWSGTLDVVDGHGDDWARGGLQLQAELVLHCGEDVGAWVGFGGGAFGRGG